MKVRRLLASAAVTAAMVILPACAGGGNPRLNVAVGSVGSGSAPSVSTEPAVIFATRDVSSPGPSVRSDASGSLPSESPASSAVPSSPVPLAPPPLACAGEKMSFSLSLSYDMVGQPTPVEAAQVYLTQPSSAVRGVAAEAVWVVGGRDPSGVTITTDSLHLHAVQLPNQTWAIDGGEACGELAAPVPTG